MSGLKDYQVETTSAFERYYDVFLQNNFRGAAYRITLKNGDEATGVATAGSVIDPSDPDVTFSFSTDDGFYKIPFRELEEAELVID